MTNSITKKRIVVSTPGDTGSYIIVPLDQIEEVKKLFDEHGVKYWCDPDAISSNGRPFVMIVNLKFYEDPVHAQNLLDNMNDG